jgi:hypothetical protein
MSNKRQPRRGQANTKKTRSVRPRRPQGKPAYPPTPKEKGARTTPSLPRQRRSKILGAERRGGREGVGAGSATGSLSHQECESMLEFYISSQTRGENADQVYPAVAQHLSVCSLCRASYLLVKDALTVQESEKAVRQDQPGVQRLTFLPTLREGDAWKTLVRSPIGGAPIGFGFAIQPRHLRESISPSAGLALRGESPPAEGRLLLADTVALGQRQVMVEVRTARSQEPDRIEVRVSMVASTPLPDPIHAVLTWNQEQRSAVVRDGKCSFDGIPISAAENAGDIRIEFRAGEETDQAK